MMCSGLIPHLKGHYFMVTVPLYLYRFNLFIIIKHYLLLNTESHCILIAGTFSLLAVLGIKVNFRSIY